jgi:hypothetical protein
MLEAEKMALILMVKMVTVAKIGFFDEWKIVMTPSPLALI